MLAADVRDGPATLGGLQNLNDLKLREPGPAHTKPLLPVWTRSLYLAMDLVYGDFTSSTGFLACLCSWRSGWRPTFPAALGGIRTPGEAAKEFQTAPGKGLGDRLCGLRVSR